MDELLLRGIPASAGSAAGHVRLLGGPPEDERELPPAERAAAEEGAITALQTAAAELVQLAVSLRRDGRTDDAAIVETGALIASDPALESAVRQAVREHGRTPPAALMQAAEGHAAAIAALGDELLAARADDVRSVGRRAARIAAGNSRDEARAAAEVVVVASDLGPADVAELGPEVTAIALAAGGVNAHAAIVARSLGVPLVVGVGDGVLAEAEPGAEAVVDGSAGVVVLRPSAERTRAARAAAVAEAEARGRARRASGLVAETRDGRRVAVLGNVAGAAEAALAVQLGAEGAGLVRTELAFLDAREWPTEDEHRRMLEAALTPLGRLPATVRVLDFGGDKSPPFLHGATERGVALLLEQAPDALLAQLRAIARVARSKDVRIMLPMVRGVADVLAARELLRQATGSDPALPLGAMVETPAAAAAAGAIATVSDFMSVGTNDLSHATLGSDRFAPGQSLAHHPQVLRLVDATLSAARERGIPAEICGEAASDALTLPLLVGLGAEELSVGAARVGTVREWVRSLDYERCRGIASVALTAADEHEVAALAQATASELLSQCADAAREGLDGGGGVIAVGPQP